MQILALAASLLFTSSLSLTVSDSVWAARNSTETESAASEGERPPGSGEDRTQPLSEPRPSSEDDA